MERIQTFGFYFQMIKFISSENLPTATISNATDKIHMLKNIQILIMTCILWRCISTQKYETFLNRFVHRDPIHLRSVANNLFTIEAKSISFTTGYGFKTLLFCTHDVCAGIPCFLHVFQPPPLVFDENESSAWKIVCVSNTTSF